MIKILQILILVCYMLPVFSQSITPFQISSCVNDTLYVPFYTDSIPSYNEISGCEITFGYKHGTMQFVGIDSSQSIIPSNKFNIKDTIYTTTPEIEYQVIEIDNGEQPFGSTFLQQKTLLTLKFVADTTVREMARGYYSTYTPEQVFIIDYRSIQTTLSFNGGILNINDAELQNDSRYLISATSGYNKYTWNYQKDYDTDYAFDSLTSNNTGVYYCGKGLYSVSTTDTNGCYIYAEEYIAIPEAIWARGTIWGNNQPAQTLVEAYINQDGTYIVKAQTQAEQNGQFIFPGTLSPGNYIIKAEPYQSDIFETTWYGNATSQDDAFVLNLNNCEGVTGLNITLTEKLSSETEQDEQENTNNATTCTFKAYPNPATNFITIELMEQAEQRLSSQSFIISNVSGNKIYGSSLQNSTQSTINVSNWQKGLYFIYLGTEVIKFWKE